MTARRARREGRRLRPLLADRGRRRDASPAGIAAALAGEHDVRLLAHEPVDRDVAGRAAATSTCRAVGVDVRRGRPAACTAASAAYDLLVNASYLSWDANRARHGLFVVHFPGPRPDGAERARRWRGRLAQPALGAPGGRSPSWASGFYTARVDPPARDPLDRAATPTLRGQRRRRAAPVPVTVLLGRYLPAAVAPIEVRAEVDGDVIGAGHGRRAVVAPRPASQRRPAVRRSTCRRASRCGSTCAARPGSRPRRASAPTRAPLGVPVIGVHAGGGWRDGLARAVPGRWPARPGVPAYLDTLRPRAGQLAVHPALDRAAVAPRRATCCTRRSTLVARGDKDPVILSVGRFFLPGTGHNKKQLEMVGAFRTPGRGRARGRGLGVPPGRRVRPRAPALPRRDPGRGRGPAGRACTPTPRGPSCATCTAGPRSSGTPPGWARTPTATPTASSTSASPPSRPCRPGRSPWSSTPPARSRSWSTGCDGYRFAGLDGLVAHTERLIADPAWRATLSLAADRARAATSAGTPSRPRCGTRSTPRPRHPLIPLPRPTSVRTHVPMQRVGRRSMQVASR